MKIKDTIPLLFSFLALLMSAVSFFQVQQDRKTRDAEEQPRISYTYSPYGVGKRFGFSIKNLGSKMARIPHITYTFNELPHGVVIAGELLEDLNLSSEGALHLIAGPNFMLEPNSTKEMYTFSEKLDKERQEVWAEYTKYIAADICYCDVQFRQCWTKRISRLAGQQVARDFYCDAVGYRKELENGTL